jgi:hypothetical protein
MDTDVYNEPAACIFKIKALYDEKEEEYSSSEVITAMWLSTMFFWYRKPRHWIIVFSVSEGIYYLRNIGKRLISEVASCPPENEKS